MIPLFLIFSFLLGFMPPIEGATQNFSISFSSMSPFVVQSYGAMEAYVAYMANTSSAFIDPSAWLLFVPQPPSNASYVLAAYVFAGSSLLEEGAIVWMANRQRPVSGNFSLTLNQSLGELILLDGDGSLAWVSNYSYTPSGAVSMHLKTNLSGDPPIGTLVLYDASNTTLWQSSDHPTHALLSNQVFEFGMNLVSWASPFNSSQGLYHLVMEAGGLALYYNRSVMYWGWSYDDRNDSFGITGITHTCRNLTRSVMDPKGGIMLQITTNLAPLSLMFSDMCPSNSSNNTVVLEEYFNDYGSKDNNDVTFLQLQQDGNLVASTLGTRWVTVYDLFAENRCLLPNFCGPYGVCTGSSTCICPPSSDGSFPLLFPSDPSKGCQLVHNLSCSPTSKQRLLPMSGFDYFANKYLSPLNFATEQMCQDVCLQNCSCLAAFWHTHTSSCFHVNNVIGSLQGSLNSSYMAYVKVKDLTESKSNVPLIAGLVSGVAALLIIMILAALIYRKRKADARKQIAHEESEPEEEDLFWNSVPGLPSRYSYKELQSITNGFSEELGKGGFGYVYLGVLQDGTKVAVKRLESLRQGTKQFRAEVLILGGVHHYNLVELIGFCSEGTHRLLVYEYMANGSLDQWLFARGKLPLEWKHRLNIALGAARGLAYLHGECKDTILHLDIKPQNILLDENFVAKVSDFGLSTLMGRDESHVITTMRGTPGYFAPEWLSEGSEISAKSDVFSFGKLLMEILGGRKNLDPSVGETDRVYFPSWLYLQTTQHGKEADLSHIARVETSEEMKQARFMLKTAFLCVLESPAQRPTMEKVVHMLQGGVPGLECLELSNLFQGLQSALRMPSPSLAHSKMEETLALLYRSLSVELGSLQGGVMSSTYISGR